MKSFYETLIQNFLNKKIHLNDFQTTYLETFKNEPDFLPEDLYEILDAFFGDVDCYTTDPNLLKENPHFYVTETQLRERAQLTLDALRKLN